MHEVFIEALEFVTPLLVDDQRLRADDQHRMSSLPCLQFLEDQTRFDRLTYPDIIGDEDARPVGLDDFQHRSELIGLVVDTSDVTGMQVSRVLLEEQRRGQSGTQRRS
ncbi:hypothetical protein BO226_08895 [Rhodococcus sp. 2G]|nr:hypothetical protein BO226_08895 [Rhodococcus sp. 2G]